MGNPSERSIAILTSNLANFMCMMLELSYGADEIQHVWAEVTLPDLEMAERLFVLYEIPVPEAMQNVLAVMRLQ